uniref:Uncharacterized protein n=1 Tax=Panagrolaimus sp. JU765 TaxID=591449 RepID=A0AC34RP78_9BILA
MKSDYEDEGEDEDEDDSGASKFTVSDLEDPGTDSEKSRESGSDGRKTDDDEEKCPEEPPDDDFVFDVSEDECEVSDATQSLTIKRRYKGNEWPRAPLKRRFCVEKKTNKCAS